MSSNLAVHDPSPNALEPLPQRPQLGIRVYQILVNMIVNGTVAFGDPLRPDVIARQLNVSTTPIREALQRLEKDGLSVKMPYQGWFVREFTEQQIRELYILRAALERLSVRLACQNLSPDDIKWIRKHQASGNVALRANDMEAYRVYNRDFHLGILRIADNSYLRAAMDQLALQSEMLSSKTIHILGRPLRGIEEHKELVELMIDGQVQKAEKLVDSHIMSALDDILSYRSGSASGQAGKAADVEAEPDFAPVPKRKGRPRTNAGRA